jgi:hypothetical protein
MRAFRKERVPVWWPVTLEEAADHGTVETFEFKARLLPLTPAQIREIASAAVFGKEKLEDVIAAHVVDWSEVIDPESGESIPFSQERLLEELDRSTDLMRGLEQALREVSSGGGERKNSKPSRAH